MKGPLAVEEIESKEGNWSKDKGKIYTGDGRRQEFEEVEYTHAPIEPWQ